MKKVTLLTVILVTLFSACKKDSVQSPVEKPKEPNISQTKLVHNIFGSQEIKKFVKNVPEIIGQTQPAKLYEAVNKKSGIHKYFLYLNGNTTNEPIIIISKKELGPQINLAKLDLKKPAHYFDDNGNEINGSLKSKNNGKIIELDETLASRESEPGEICIDWYWIIVDTYTGEVVGEIFIETKCYKQGGDLGGGGGGGGEYNCYNIQESDFNNEVSGATVTAETESFEIYSIGPFEKAKNPKWKILSGLGGWSLHSQEIGTIKLVDVENDVWNWKSLQHGNITMQGPSLPGTNISYTQGIATVNLYTLYAGMSLDFNVTYSFVCNCPGIPLVNTLVPPVPVNYVSTNIWDAKPE